MSPQAARLASRGTLIIILVLAAMLGQRPSSAAAHPLDEYLQAMYVTLTPGGVTLEVDLSPGLLVAPQVVALIDTNGDSDISEQEGQVYARSVLRDVMFEVDGQSYALAVTKSEFPSMLALTSGLGTIRLEAVPSARTDGPPTQVETGSHLVFVQNTHAPVRSVYQSTVALDRAGGIEVAQQRRDELQQSLRVDYSVAPLAQAKTGATEDGGAWSLWSPVEQQRWLVNTLYQPAMAPSLLLLALGLSAVLGGLHALTPGHGKTLLASYLVGSHGSVRHALFLGGAVTLTHTASVIAMGLLVLLAGHLIVPNLLLPALELGSGIIVVFLGARLIRGRWQALQHGHEHNHPHAHTYVDAHPMEGVRWRDLAAMGVSGGVIPCPEAIGILLVAIGLNRVAFGMGLIVAFSVGLAIVLSLLGLLLVRSRGLVDRFGKMGERTQRLLPLGSAIVVAVLGVGICVKGALAYLS